MLAMPRFATASPNEKTRLGLIGAGSRGNQLLDSFFRQPDCEIIAIADVDDRHAGETAKRVKKEKGNLPQNGARLSIHARPQRPGRCDHRHARSLARSSRDPGSVGRQGRLCRKAGGT